MTRINTNIAALQAMRDLRGNNKALNSSLEKLSTGFRINRASDGPASLVISERLRSQVAAMNQAVDNTERATNIVRTAEGALDEVNRLLTSIQDLVLEAANDGAISKDEILANQAEIDSAVETINRIANTTSFAGIRLLDGTRDYTTSGVARGNISELSINGAGIFNTTSQVAVTVRVTQNASQAILSNSSSGIGASGAQLLVSGNRGSQLLTFNSSAANSAILAAVNSVTGNTGVSATLSSSTLFFQSEYYGDDQFVAVKDIQNVSASTQYMNARDFGANVAATVNGLKVETDGLKIKVDTFNLKADITLSANYYDALRGATTSATSTFHITGGGFAFNIGNETASNHKAFVGLQRMTAENLGDRSVGFLSDLTTGGTSDLSTNPDNAQDIIEKAIDDVTRLRARLGAWETNTFQSQIHSLEEAVKNLTEAESRIRDVDFAAETTTFTKNQILVQASTSVLAQANLTPQSVLQLLG